MADRAQAFLTTWQAICQRVSTARATVLYMIATMSRACSLSYFFFSSPLYKPRRRNAPPLPPRAR
jgi:hypothetical protein